ncbi:ABC transporter [Lachnospiraceae bacterium TWA4]|nr:ABC transporter [Lachnospiraceae bacterium TWA4]
MTPFYRLISGGSLIFIFWFGGKNVLGTGWTSWDIAAFVTFHSCYMKLALKSSRVAKLFHSVQKAVVSWIRIYPYMLEVKSRKSLVKEVKLGNEIVRARNLSFAYTNDKKILNSTDFTLKKGQIIGLAGPVACGKSTVGKLFLGELNYDGSLLVDGGISYMGHEPELIAGTIKENILLGDHDDVWRYLKLVCMDEEVQKMKDGVNTRIGNGGVTLSGGQQARVALARTLCHKKSLLVLDDPFSAVDMKTEELIFENLRQYCKEHAILLISHRLSRFPDMDAVFWLENGQLIVSNHEELVSKRTGYQMAYQMQKGEGV